MPFICISILFIPVSLYSKDWTKKCQVTHYNGRSLEETCRISLKGDSLYSYSVVDICAKIDSLREIRMDVMSITKYPIWYNQIRIRVERKEFATLCHYYCGKTEDSVFDIKVFLDETGQIYCYKILSKNSLLATYSTEEIISIFDKINTIRFSPPIFEVPPTGGYCTLSLW